MDDREELSLAERLFRPRAVSERVRGLEAEGAALRLRTGWIGLAFWLLLAVFAGAAVWAWGLQLEDTVDGPCIVAEPRIVLVTLPASAVARVASGMAARIVLRERDEPIPAHVVSVDGTTARVRLEAAAEPPGARGTATVVLRSRRLLVALFPRAPEAPEAPPRGRDS